MENRKGRKERKKERKKDKHRESCLGGSEFANRSCFFCLRLRSVCLVGKGSRQVTSRFGVGIVQVLYEGGIVKPRGRFV